MRTLLSRIRTLFRGKRLEGELNDEVGFHLSMLEEEFRARGMTAEQARAAARREFGGVAQTLETYRERRGLPWLETTLKDLRYALRQLRAAPAFTTVAVLSLALGIGANAALFSLMNVMLLKALPVKNPEELVEFVRATPDSMMTNLPLPVFEYFQRGRGALASVFAVCESNPVFSAGGSPERTRAHEVSGGFFPSLGVQPLLGRTIAPDDDKRGAPNRVAVIGYGFWSREFGRDASALGAAVRISGERYTVVGVMPPQFFGIDRARIPDLWIPLAADPDPGEVWVLGRLRRGVSLAQARAELDPLFRQALESMRDDFKLSPESERRAFFSQRLVVNRANQGTPDARWSYWDYSNTLKILIGLTCVTLLIACANLASLLMARSAARSREIGVRLALGAGRWRLVRQLMTENLLLALAGGALGAPVAAWGHRLVLGFLMRDTRNAALDFQLDYRLVGFGLGLSIATGLLFGLAPAIRATRADLSSALHAAARQSGSSSVPLARALLAVQIALTVVLLVGAGLFARSLRNLASADLGVARDNLLLMDVRPTVKTPEARRRFWTEAMGSVTSAPGVRGVALGGDAVFGNGGWNQTVWIDRPGQAAQDASVSENLVSPGFFATAGIPVLGGREFGELDRENGPLVAVVNRAFAQRYYGGANPIGRRFGDRGEASSTRYEIVGVVADAKYGAVRDAAGPMVFHPLWQEPPRASYVVHVRADGDPAALGPSIQRRIEAIDGDALVSNIRTLPGVLRGQLRQDRMFATLAGFFALLALALSAIGIYGIVAYRVARRTAEIGVRMALGAGRGDVLWMVLRETFALLLAGMAAGIPAALAAARLIKSQLFGLGPFDPATVVVATVTLFAAGTLAGFLPARKAAAADPLRALRQE
jgi:predicted permease